MAVFSDLRQLVQRQSFDQQHRTLILIDQVNGGKVWGKFVHRYDQSHKSPVDLYFDTSFRALRVAEENVVFTADVLPILSHLGKYQITIVRHTHEGCVVESGDPSTIDGMVGIER